MRFKIVTDCLLEPIEVDEIFTHLKIDEDQTTLAEISMVQSYITAARRYCENIRSEAFLTKTIDAVSQSWDDLQLPILPVQSISSIKYTDSADVEHTLTADELYHLDTYAGKIVLKYGESWPSDTLRTSNPIVVRYLAGYGDTADEVPADYIKAIILLVFHFWRNREETADKKYNSDMITRVMSWEIDKLLMVTRDVGL